MPIASLVSQLPHLPPPVLTAYLDTYPANPRNQSTPRAYPTWVKSAAQEVGRDLPPEMRRQMNRQLRRVTKYLSAITDQNRSLVLFAGPDVWQEVRLQAPVHDELHWGKPSLQQMTWVLDEHRLRGAVLVDRSGARFFRFWMGTVTADGAVALSIGQSGWRKPHLVGPATPGVTKQSGVQRDRVSARVEAQRDRFAVDLARRIAYWSRKEQISPVILVGEQKQIEAGFAALPGPMREDFTLLPKILSRTSPSQVQRELEPVLRDWERDYEEQQVEKLLSTRDPSRAALGIDETLHQLQRRHVRELVIARGLKGTARQCLSCGWVDRTADSACPLCGSSRRSRTLRTVLPELASALGVPTEIVAGQAAERLREAGGIGAWLGVRKSKEPLRKLTVTPLPEQRTPRRRKRA